MCHMLTNLAELCQAQQPTSCFCHCPGSRLIHELSASRPELSLVDDFNIQASSSFNNKTQDNMSQFAAKPCKHQTLICNTALDSPLMKYHRKASHCHAGVMPNATSTIKASKQEQCCLIFSFHHRHLVVCRRSTVHPYT